MYLSIMKLYIINLEDIVICSYYKVFDMIKLVDIVGKHLACLVTIILAYNASYVPRCLKQVGYIKD